eukprot:366362-Chlamydomonas_euryale.AAC.6
MRSGQACVLGCAACAAMRTPFTHASTRAKSRGTTDCVERPHTCEQLVQERSGAPRSARNAAISGWAGRLSC